jgi:hypothetical protein
MSHHDRRHSRRKFYKSTSPTNAQAIILSGLNVLQTLEEQTPKYLHDVLHYGPKSFVGKDWAAALIWFRKKGYHEYKELTLFGVWAVAHEDENHLLIGIKNLAFTAPVFNPESYMQLIRHNFQTHYKDDGSPPPEGEIVTHTKYNAAKRLALRQDIKDTIVQWLKNRQ